MKKDIFQEAINIMFKTMLIAVSLITLIIIFFLI